MTRRVKPIKSLLFIGLLCCCLGFTIQGQTVVPLQEQEQTISPRAYDEQKLEEFRQDPNYEYTPLKIEEDGAFTRFWKRLGRWFRGLFRNETTANIWEILWRLLLFAGFIIFVIKIFGIEPQSIFSRTKVRSKDGYAVDEESLDAINFEEEIQKTMANGQWRLGVRLIYLYALKHLSDVELIAVKKGKTNYEYLYEIGEHSIRNEFSSLSLMFDYTWYGHFEADQSMADRARGYLNGILKTKGGKGEN